MPSFSGGIWSCAALRDLSLCWILRHSHHRHTCIQRTVRTQHAHTPYTATNVLRSKIRWHGRLEKELDWGIKGRKMRNKSGRKWSILRCSRFLSHSLSSFQTTPRHGTGPNPRAFVCSLAFPLSLSVSTPFLYPSVLLFYWPFSIL